MGRERIFALWTIPLLRFSQMFHDTDHLFGGETANPRMIPEGNQFLFEDVVMVDPTPELHDGAPVGEMGII